MLLFSTAVAGVSHGPRGCDMGPQKCRLPRDSRVKNDIGAKEGLKFNSTLGPNRINQIPLLPETLERASPVLPSFSKISTLCPHVI